MDNKIVDELNEFMVSCLKRHAGALACEEKPMLLVLTALVDALAMQVVFNGVTDEQALGALKLRLEGVRARRAGGEMPGKIEIDLTPGAKA